MMDDIAVQIGTDMRAELLVLYDNGRRTIGEKMNLLTWMAQGDYIAGVADDDDVEPDYIATLLAAIDEKLGVDVIAFNHEYYVDGKRRATIRESRNLNPDSNDWDKGELTRHPSNKCAVRTDLARGFAYPHSSDGEDTAFSKWLRLNSETEFHIDRSLYHYRFRSENKRFRRVDYVNG